jgi:hypothetical protein
MNFTPQLSLNMNPRRTRKMTTSTATETATGHAHAAAKPAPASTAAAPPVVIKLGSQTGKKIRQLRKGKGKLLDKVLGTITHLQGAGTLSAGAQAVVIVVKEKKKGMKLFKI